MNHFIRVVAALMLLAAGACGPKKSEPKPTAKPTVVEAPKPVEAKPAEVSVESAVVETNTPAVAVEPAPAPVATNETMRAEEPIAAEKKPRNPKAYGVSDALLGAGRIVFIGDSITQGGDYVTDFECFLLANGLTNEVINIGLSSETATDLTEEENAPHKTAHGFGRPNVSERLARALTAVKPDWLVVCYGMNDAENLPDDDSGAARFVAACEFIRTTALGLGARRVTICTPPVYDIAPGGGDLRRAHNISTLSGGLLAKRSAGWSVADIYEPMTQALDAGRRLDPNFKFANDGVHPGREGHWLMAQQVIAEVAGLRYEGVPAVEELFPKNGEAIRKLVRSRTSLLHAAWMTETGHTRPGVAGGPKAKPGPTLEEAAEKSAEISAKIEALL